MLIGEILIGLIYVLLLRIKASFVDRVFTALNGTEEHFLLILVLNSGSIRDLAIIACFMGHEFVKH